MNSDVRHWAEKALGTPVHEVQQMAGSSSTTLYRLRAGDRLYVLRLFDNAEWLADEPDLAQHEAAALGKAAETGLPCPEVVAFDEGGVCDLPLILMTHLPGRVELQPVDFNDWLHQQAEALVRIHALDTGDYPWRYFPWFEVDDLIVPEWSEYGDEWARVIAIALGPEPAYHARFLHRDYHPVNLLFQDGWISGVVDWVNACIGPVGVDVAHCRGNLVTMYGLEVADQFLEYYQALAGDTFTYDPYWDICNLVGLLPGPLDAYPPWAGFGLHITDAMVQERAEAWLRSLVARL